MKKKHITIFMILVVLALSGSAMGKVLFSDDFDSYAALTDNSVLADMNSAYITPWPVGSSEIKVGSLWPGLAYYSGNDSTDTALRMYRAVLDESASNYTVEMDVMRHPDYLCNWLVGARMTDTAYIVAGAVLGSADPVTGDAAMQKKAKEIYNRLICYYQNPDLLVPKMYPQTRACKSHAMPMIVLSASQQIRKTGADQLYNDIIDESLRVIFEDFLHYDKQALLETVGPDGEFIDSPDGRCVCPGHAIESAWFIMEEGRYRNDRNLIGKACLILDWSLELGWDKEFEGISYFVDVDGKPSLQYEHDMKLWWVHNESLYATLLAYHLTGKEKYEQWYERIHKYVYSHFPDTEHGEWFKYLHRDGSVSNRAKGNGWAGPFHLPRMQFNSWRLLAEMKKLRKTNN